MMLTVEELTILVSEEDLVITVNDARAVYNGCVPGWKLFAETNGLDWKEVRKHGLKASELLAINDSMALELVRYKYEQR
jgi:hypothetical protein